MRALSQAGPRWDCPGLENLSAIEAIKKLSPQVTYCAADPDRLVGLTEPPRWRWCDLNRTQRDGWRRDEHRQRHQKLEGCWRESASPAGIRILRSRLRRWQPWHYTRGAICLDRTGSARSRARVVIVATTRGEGGLITNARSGQPARAGDRARERLPCISCGLGGAYLPLQAEVFPTASTWGIFSPSAHVGQRILSWRR